MIKKKHKYRKQNIINIFRFNLNCQQIININMVTGFTIKAYRKRINYFYSYVHKNIIFLNYDIILITIKKIMLFLLNLFIKRKNFFFYTSYPLMKSYASDKNYFIFNEKWKNGLLTNHHKMRLHLNKMLNDELERLVNKNYEYFCKKYNVEKITTEIRLRIKKENQIFLRYPSSFFFCKEDKKDLNTEHIITEIHNKKIPTIFCLDTKTDLPNIIKNILYVLPTNTTSASSIITHVRILNNIIISSKILKKKKIYNFF